MHRVPPLAMQEKKFEEQAKASLQLTSIQSISLKLPPCDSHLSEYPFEMAALLLGGAKAYTSLMGIGFLTFTMTMRNMEVQMEELQLDAEDIEELEILPAEIEEGEKGE